MTKLTIPDFKNVTVLVAGDLMLDRYWFGQTGRISPEAPVPVVRIEDTVEKPGGAGNVAMNITSLGASCNVVGITGKDAESVLLAKCLQENGIGCGIHAVAEMETITKLRVISRNQQLIRLDFESGPSEAELPALEKLFTAQLKKTNTVILSDYAKGTLGGVSSLIKIARQAGKPVLVDPKGGDFEKYAGATLLTPNYPEFEVVAGVCANETEFETKAMQLMQSLGLDALLVTRSEKGMSLFQKDCDPVHLPAETREVFDVTGAGDTVIALLASSIGAGASVLNAARIANLGAGLVVARLGAASVSASELQIAARRDIEGAHRVISQTELLELVGNARKHGESIVMTNGCFDILHAGHVAYLKEASQLGDRLIVAVNDDASVSRLKGAGRPVLTVEERMSVLAGLDSVDWVVSFSEETPEKLICTVLPDLLVKGGDYKPADIAGYDCVTRGGGTVKILRYHAGRSSTSIIEKLRGK
ncbi:MAG: bifunctional D-glycero-beta-D-manno-heptose-7-phosphate kinase/D-glycero-beta-D-manno-heptose 1-phosphate adenylyltransferase HldE [Gammaproteobacteria bacterium]